MTKYHPLRELSLARLREFLREPEGVFWTYGFPLLLAVGLRIALRNRPIEKVYVDVQEQTMAAGAGTDNGKSRHGAGSALHLLSSAGSPRHESDGERLVGRRFRDRGHAGK